MSSNLADLPLVLLADLPPRLTSNGQICGQDEFKFGRSTPLSFLELQKSLLVSFQGCWTQWQRFESSSTHHFWDSPQHFLKTHICWECGFLSFLVLQKSLLVSFQGSWIQWQRFESSSIHCFWDTPLYFLKTCFNLESGCLSFLELQKSPLVSYQGCWTQVVKMRLFGRSTPRSASRCIPLLTSSGQEWQFQVSIVTVDISRSTGRSIPILKSCGKMTLSFLELQKSPLVSFQGCWTQWQSGQDEFKFGRSTPRPASRCIPLLTSSGKEWQFWFSIVTADKNRSTGRSTAQYSHLVVKMTLSFLELQKSPLVSFQGCWTQWQSGQDEIKFGRSTPRSASRCIPLLTSSGQEWQFQVSIVTVDISRSTGRSIPILKFCGKMTLSFLELQKSPLVSFQGCWTQWQSGQDEFKFGRSTPGSAGRSTP